MNHLRVVLMVLVFSQAPGVAWGYEPLTHELMAEKAVDTSSLAKDPELLKDLGLKPLAAEQEFRNSKGDEHTVVQLFRDGANFEDNAPRFLNHFYDPINNRGLRWGLVSGAKSPDWALEDEFDYRLQYYSYRHANEYLYLALTTPHEEQNQDNISLGRNEYFGRLFQTLGQVIHHLQDMAQPQHVRNDAHPPVGSHASFYEKYTDRSKIRLNLPFTGYPGVTFDTVRKFWHTDETDLMKRRGIADYTNRGFVSAGTNFQYLDDQISLNTEYQNPNYDGVSESIPIANLYQELDPPESVPTVVNPETGQQGPLAGSIDFYKTVVTDAYDKGKTETNERASSLSVFDADLQKYNVTVTLKDNPGQDDDGVYEEVTIDRLFTLNRFNFDAAHEFLIPRAVAYSAGLINHFFRGRIKVIEPRFTAEGIALKIKNNIDIDTYPFWKDENLKPEGRDNKSSLLVITYEYTNDDGIKRLGTAAANENFTDTLFPGQTSTEYSFDLPQEVLDDLPAATFRLVYRGGLGQEDDAVMAAPLEKVMTGFLVSPNYAPEDGLSQADEPRLIYKHNGQWKLSKVLGLKAGNIDWKGWFVGGKPTQVLTWVGPQARSVSEKGGFRNKVYKGGKIYAVAPCPVLGASLIKGSTMDFGWLIVVCQGTAGDVIYQRQAFQDYTAAVTDPLNPDNPPVEWKEIGRLPKETVDGWEERGTTVPWFFNGDGTEAQTVRRYQSPTSKYGYRPGRKKINLVLTGDTIDVTTDVFGAGPGFSTTVRNCTSNYDEDGAGSSEWEAKAEGDWVIAVDYKNNTEVLAKIVYRGSNIGSVAVSVTKDADGRKIGEKGGASVQQGDGEYLSFGGKDLHIVRIVDNYIWNWENDSESSAYSFNLEYTHDQKNTIYYIDLRHDILSYDDALYFQKRSGDGKTDVLDITYTDETAIISSVAPLQTLHRATTDLTITRPGINLRRVSCWQVGNSYKNWYWTNIWVADGYRSGAWLVDVNGNALFSQNYYVDYYQPSNTNANYISDGELARIIPGAPTSGLVGYFPAWLIK